MIDYLNDHVPPWAIVALAVIVVVYLGLAVFAFVSVRGVGRRGRDDN